MEEQLDAEAYRRCLRRSVVRSSRPLSDLTSVSGALFVMRSRDGSREMLRIMSLNIVQPADHNINLSS